MKKNTLLFAIAFVALSFTAQAQTLVGYRSPNPGTRNIGYEMAIKPQFDYIALDFSEGMACVRFKMNEFHTYIDTTGKPVFDKKYVNVNPFSNGYAAVEVEPNTGIYTFIDHNGKPLTEQTVKSPNRLKVILWRVYQSRLFSFFTIYGCSSDTRVLNVHGLFHSFRLW